MESIFSKRLKEERKNQNLTQQQLADLINKNNYLDVKISRNSITRYENGTRTPDYNTLFSLSEVLDVDIDYLLGKSDKKHLGIIRSEMDDFIYRLNKMFKKDDTLINKQLISILSNIIEVIRRSYKNNNLHSLDEIIGYLSMIINYDLTNNDLNHITELKEKLIDCFITKNQDSFNEMCSKYIPEILETVEEFGISKLSSHEIIVLNLFYHNKNNIPNILDELFNHEQKK